MVAAMLEKVDRRKTPAESFVDIRLAHEKPWRLSRTKGVMGIVSAIRNGGRGCDLSNKNWEFVAIIFAGRNLRLDIPAGRSARF
jgi:hypothetical protein